MGYEYVIHFIQFLLKHAVINELQLPRTEIFSDIEASINILKEGLPQNTSVFPTFGNHDVSPVNGFAPLSEQLFYNNFGSLDVRYTPTSAAYAHMAELYKSWLPEESLAVFRQKGSYVVRPWTGFKILSLNTNYCYSFDFFTYVRGEAEDVDQVLEWIVGELADSENRGEKVWIGKASVFF